MPTEEELLNLIATATTQLSGLKLLPRDEPTGDEPRAFRCVLKIQGTSYTYLLLRIPDTSEWGGSWYATGSLIEGQRVWIRWPEMRARLSKYTIIEWVELVPKVDAPAPLPNSLEE